VILPPQARPWGPDSRDRPTLFASDAALWPTPGQELLLRAALTPGPKALEAWEAWKADHDLIESQLDHGSFRLLPLVYKNLVAMGADEPLMPRLKGIYRYWWCTNQRLFHRAAIIINTLEQAGIRTLVLKGASASVAYYRDRGARPMGDIDLLVSHDHASAAIARLGTIGLRPARPRVADLIRYQHSVRMVHDTGEALDLHWHVLAECIHRDADHGFWKRAAPIRVLDAPSLALGPTDALLHAIVHGMRWNAEPTVRWVADAMTILRSSEDAIDWVGLHREASRLRVLLRLRAGLEYLEDAMDAPIPYRAMARLRGAHPAAIEHLERRVLTLGSNGRRLQAGHLLLIIIQYLRFVSGMHLFQAVAETPAYLRYRLRGRRGPVLDAVRRVVRGGRRLFSRRIPTDPPPSATATHRLPVMKGGER
jgi:putative nucleotidyltransferase-like protein